MIKTSFFGVVEENAVGILETCAVPSPEAVSTNRCVGWNRIVFTTNSFDFKPFEITSTTVRTDSHIFFGTKQPKPG